MTPPLESFDLLRAKLAQLEAENAALREENGQMAFMLAEPSENQILKEALRDIAYNHKGTATAFQFSEIARKALESLPQLSSAREKLVTQLRQLTDPMPDGQLAELIDLIIETEDVK